MPSIPLPHAVPGAVVTRFPPEPSWHLDIGHCKAALMNQFVAAQFQVPAQGYDCRILAFLFGTRPLKGAANGVKGCWQTQQQAGCASICNY
jgi:hypothetical protein